MATEVLYPQDCLIDRITVPSATFKRRRSKPHPRVFPAPAKSRSHPRNLVAGHVTISKRGELLESKIASGYAATGNVMIAAGGEFSDVYAGSAFAVSPAPESLPLPSFSKKKVTVDDSATRDLRRLLGLD